MSSSQPTPRETPESNEPSVSVPGGFKNDPDDPTSPNEAIERHRRTVRPNPLPPAGADKPRDPPVPGGEDE